MTSRGSFKSKLYNILVDLSNIKPANETLQTCIQDKLDRSYEQYDNTMKSIYNYVLSRSNDKVVKALSRVRKTKESNNGD